MKKKILITSILLGLTTVVLIGYFVAGCSSLKGIASRRNESQRVVYAEVDEKDAETGVQPVVVAEPQKPRDGVEMLEKVVAQDVADKEGNRSSASVQPKTDTSPTPAEEVTSPKEWNTVFQDHHKSKREGDEISRADSLAVHADRAPILLGDPNRGDGMMGGGGGMGGRGSSSRYGGGMLSGVQPTGPQAQARTPGLSSLPIKGLFEREKGSVSVRSIPVELINVSADELWIIAKAEVQPVPVPPDGESPGTGAMLAKLPKKDKKVPLPLKHTDVKGQISGYIATVSVTQQFHNPYDEKIEAVYVFPLPQNAAINEFIMTIGKRRIRGIIRERKEAERIYQQARSQGYVASLLTQERPNIFTQKVANIEPKKQIDVNIKYFNTLAYVDGWYEFVFPMVVGPRFNPPGFNDGVGAVGRGITVISGQKTDAKTE
ncbi:MAG: VIT domain-containing protein, partial [Planctomycetota bacterium]|nr:VIT domain-containing protein [Planctomycetota bacterium]